MYIIINITDLKEVCYVYVLNDLAFLKRMSISISVEMLLSSCINVTQSFGRCA